MSLMDNEQKYGLISSLFHWTMAILLFVNYLLGSVVEDFENNPFINMNLHMTLGCLIFLIGTLRLAWRFLNLEPQPIQQNRMLKKISNNIFILFYSLIFLIPISGYALTNADGYLVSFFGKDLYPVFHKSDLLEDFFEESHEILANLLLLLVALHVSAALYHKYIEKIDIFKRIGFR